MLNGIQTWKQGKFIDGPEFSETPDETKKNWREQESLMVRPSARGNFICVARNPEDAVWIAQRLNLASKLEQMTYDFATGKSDGTELVDFVRANADAI